jgi:hypothetical protein
MTAVKADAMIAGTTAATAETIAVTAETTDVMTGAIGTDGANVAKRDCREAPGGSAAGRFSLSDPYGTAFRSTDAAAH